MKTNTNNKTAVTTIPVKNLTRFVSNMLICTVGISSVINTNVLAAEIEYADWTFDFGGYINTHAIYVSCDSSNNTVAGNALLCTGDNATGVTNGYSPASFSFKASTVRKGFDINAVLAIEPGTTDNAAFNGNGDNKAYRAYFTVGNSDVGTIKAGRDYGVFGIDIVLEDMSLGGVGAPALIKSPLNTQLGAAGYGYIFTDRLSQITYSYTSKTGLSGVLGVFQPLDLLSFGGNGYTGDSGSKQPGIHGKLRYDFAAGYLSSTFLQQDVTTPLNSYSAFGVDVTAAINVANNRLVLSAFNADGLGYYGLLIDAADINANPRQSSGWFAQATHTRGATKFGINYGVSRVDRTEQDTAIQLDAQKKLTLGVYHTLWEMFTVSAEFSDIKASNHQHESIENRAVSVGLAISF